MSRRSSGSGKQFNGELASLYKNSFSNLESAERSGQNCTQSRVELVSNFKSDLTEQVDMLCEMLENTIQEKDDVHSCLCESNEQQDMFRLKMEESCKEIECLKEQNSTLQSTIKNLNAEMERMSIDATRELEEQDEELCKLRRHLEKLTCTLNKATDDLDQTMVKLQQAEQAGRCAQAEICELQENHRQLELKFESYRRGHRFTNDEVHGKEDDIRSLSGALQESECENRTIKQKLCDLSRGGFS